MPESIDFTDEELMAYADGELSPARAAALADRLAADAGLQRRLARYSQTRDALRSAFASSLEAPMPARLLALFEPDTPATLPSAPPTATPRPRRRRRATIWAMAASLVFAVGLTTALLLKPDGQAETAARAELQPDATLLGRVLEAQASGDPIVATVAGRSEEILPVSTLRTADARYCRLFDARYAKGESPSRHVRGLACRESPARWTIVAVIDADAVTAAGASIDRYVTAGADGPDPQRLLPGAAPLTPPAEMELIHGGWR